MTMLTLGKIWLNFHLLTSRPHRTLAFALAHWQYNPDFKQDKGTVMLSLTRRSGQTIVLQTETEEIKIHFHLDDKQIKVAIDAPEEVRIVRKELLV